MFVTVIISQWLQIYRHPMVPLLDFHIAGVHGQITILAQIYIIIPAVLGCLIILTDIAVIFTKLIGLKMNYVLR